jgi:hypothetical protein
MTMNKIKDKLSLELEISRLKIEIDKKELVINEQFEKISTQLEPGALMKSGITSMFSSNTVNKTIVSTGLSLLTGFLVERIILRKSNVLVKYGIAQIAMSLVSQLAEQNWQPEIMTRIKAALSSAIESVETDSSD